MEYLQIYLGIGCLLSLYLAFYYFIHRKKLSKPISEISLLKRMIVYALLWPICVKTMLSKNIVKLASVSEPLLPDLNKSYESRMKELQELWDTPPLCGQQVFARGVNAAEYKGLASAFIFDTAELAATLANNPLSKGDFQSDEASIARWLSCRDRQLNCITKVPNQWGRIPYVIEQALEDGVGEAFCPTCQCCYPASQLVKPVSTFKPGWNYNSIHCPKNHLLNKTEGMHVNMG